MWSTARIFFYSIQIAFFSAKNIVLQNIIHYCMYKTVFSYSTWCVQVLRSPKEAFAAAMQSWRERCEKCVCLQGDYVEK